MCIRDRLNYTVGDGTEDATMTFTGTIADINTALQWVVFRPDGDFTGTAGLTITTNDQGYFGTGGPQSDVDTVDISVTAVPPPDDSPSWTTLPGALDSSFGTDGRLTVSAGDVITETVVLPDGTILAVGESGGDFLLAKFNDDGSLVSGFGTDGVADDTGMGLGLAATLLVQDDGKILVGGDGSLARYLSLIHISEPTRPY